MAKPLNLQDIIAANPMIDPKRLSEALEAIAKLRASGLTAPDYKLGSPFARRMRPAEPPTKAIRLPVRTK